MHVGLHIKISDLGNMISGVICALKGTELFKSLPFVWITIIIIIITNVHFYIAPSSMLFYKEERSLNRKRLNRWMWEVKKKKKVDMMMMHEGHQNVD